MQRIAPLALILLAAGCAGPPEFSAPAPASALDCAIHAAEHLGYTRMAGGDEDGFVRMEIRTPPAPAEKARTAPPPENTAAPTPPNGTIVERNPPDENQLLFHMDGGRLHIEVLGVTDEGQPVKPAQDALDHAQMVLARCTA